MRAHTLPRPHMWTRCGCRAGFDQRVRERGLRAQRGAHHRSVLADVGVGVVEERDDGVGDATLQQLRRRRLGRATARRDDAQDARIGGRLRGAEPLAEVLGVAHGSTDERKAVPW